MLKKKTLPATELKSDLKQWSQIRRCHRCGETHETKGDRVDMCGACGARFAPYFFAELTPEALMDSGKTPFAKPESLVLSSAKAYRPVVGVTWWWSDSAKTSAGELLMPRA